MTKAADSGVANIGNCARSHIDSKVSDTVCPSATISTGGSSLMMREMRRTTSSVLALVK